MLNILCVIMLVSSAGWAVTGGKCYYLGPGVQRVSWMPVADDECYYSASYACKREQCRIPAYQVDNLIFNVDMGKVRRWCHARQQRDGVLFKTIVQTGYGKSVIPDSMVEICYDGQQVQIDCGDRKVAKISCQDGVCVMEYPSSAIELCDGDAICADGKTWGVYNIVDAKGTHVAEVNAIWGAEGISLYCGEQNFCDIKTCPLVGRPEGLECFFNKPPF